MVDGVLHVSKAFEIVVVRHGRTAWNRDGRFQGHADVALDDDGVRQAKGLHDLLAATTFSRAVTSDLSRAFETAAIVLGERRLPLEIDQRFREMRFGAWEGLTWPQIVARDPSLAERPAKTPKYFTPQGGESFDDVCARVAAGAEAIARRAAPGDVVLLATHAGPLHALLRVSVGAAEADALGVRFDPGTLTRIALGPDGARVIELNVAPAHAS